MKASFLVFFLLPLQIFAQNIAGIWTGTLITAQKNIPYELVISETEGRLTGYSYIAFTVKGVEFVAVKTLDIKESKGGFEIEEENLIYNNFTEEPPKRIRQIEELALEDGGSEKKLEGTFTTKKGLDLKPIAGEIVLTKRNDLEKTKLITKLDELGLSADLSFYQIKRQQQEKATLVSDTSTTQLPTDQIVSSSVPKMKAPPPPPPKPKDTVKEEPVVKLKPKDSVMVAVKPIAPSKPKVVAPVAAPKPPVVRVAPPVAKVVPPSPKPVVVAKPVPSPVAKVVAPPLPKVQPKPENIPTGSGADIAKRKIENIETLYFHSDSLELILYDNGIVDGDTVSVFLNGKVIMGKVGLSTDPVKKIVYITPDLGDSLQFVMYAENLGSIPPNTGLLIINDGKIRHEIFFSGDLEKNAAITLRRQPDK